ncbi:MAG: M20/M25/M40 family metallo-hydrolase [Thermoleophilia bacterium]|nr:M20/M25/M40 family metallo-hydrolase [Thermoleophilia bacterium]
MTPEELDRLYTLLRVPSVSALPEHVPDMARAAALVADEVRRAGGTAEIVTGDGHPLVVGEVPPSDGRAGAPRVIAYGHYDVQPSGDRALWTSDPFEPVVRDGDLYCRGASDDKGNMFMLLAAVQRLSAAGALPVHVSFVIDGEEESGGTMAVRHIAADPAPAAAAIVFDTAMVAPERPSVCSGLRGLVYRRIAVRTAASDAHSGVYGGAGLNAAHALIALLEHLRPHDGRLDPRLMAGLAEPSPEEVGAWDGLPPGGEVLGEAGLRPADPAAAAQLYRRTLAMPSLDVHGLACGEPTAVKTNLPAEATATLSLRVAPGQDAAALADALDALIRDAAPAGAEVTITRLGEAHPALMDPRDPVVAAAIAAIERSTGWPCVPVRSGGSIPIVAAFTAKGIPTVLSGFALPDDGIHGPDEHLRFEHLGIGTRAAMEILTALGGLAGCPRTGTRSSPERGALEPLFQGAGRPGRASPPGHPGRPSAAVTRGCPSPLVAQRDRAPGFRHAPGGEKGQGPQHARVRRVPDQAVHTQPAAVPGRRQVTGEAVDRAVQGGGGGDGEQRSARAAAAVRVEASGTSTRCWCPGSRGRWRRAGRGATMPPRRRPCVPGAPREPAACRTPPDGDGAPVTGMVRPRRRPARGTPGGVRPHLARGRVSA